MLYPEQVNVYRQRVGEWLPKAEAGVRRVRDDCKGTTFFQGRQQCSHVDCGDPCGTKTPKF